MTTPYAKPVHTTVVGVVPDRESAQRALAGLRAAGFRDEQFGVIGPGRTTPAPGEEHSGLANDPTHTRWEEGAGIGAAAGAVTGLGLGLAVAAGVMLPLGPVVAGGTLVALLASAGGGAAVGTLVGGLIGLGIPEEEARLYEADLKAGRVLVTVHQADERSDVARSVIRDHGGRVREPADVGTYGTGLPATPH
jgi:hypothetical protein